VLLKHNAALNYLKLRYGLIDERLGFPGKTYPALLTIGVTNKCNLKCSFCMCRALYDGEPVCNLKPQTLQKILNDELLKKVLAVILTGGEPLLNPHLPDLVEVVKKRGTPCRMLSNGTLFEQNLGLIKDLKKRGLCEIQISVYDNTKYVLADTLRHIAGYLPVSITYVIERSKLLKDQKTGFVNIIDVINMVKSAGCVAIRFNNCNDDAGGCKNFPVNSITSEDAPVYDELVLTCKSKLKNVSFSGYGARLGFPSGKFNVFFPSPINPNSGEKNCRVPWNINLHSDGNMTPCCKLQRETTSVETSLEYTVNADKFVKLRRSLIDKNVPIDEECAKCAYNNHAYGSTI